MANTDEEWNHVSRKRGRKPAQKTSPGRTSGLCPNPHPELSVDEIRKYHEGVVQDWQASDSWRSLQEILVAMSSGPKQPPITKAVCLGPGPFDPINGSLSIKRTAHMQTAAFGSIVANLETHGNGKIRCIIQEPSFTEVDKQVCRHLGFEVAESPDAFSLVDANTLLFGIHMELPTYYEALHTLPSIFIGTDLGSWEKLMDFDPTAPEVASLQKIHNAYDKHPFPDLNYMFYGTTIYSRRVDGRASKPVEMPIT